MEEAINDLGPEEAVGDGARSGDAGQGGKAGAFDGSGHLGDDAVKRRDEQPALGFLDHDLFFFGSNGDLATMRRFAE